MIDTLQFLLVMALFVAGTFLVAGLGWALLVAGAVLAADLLA